MRLSVVSLVWELCGNPPTVPRWIRWIPLDRHRHTGAIPLSLQLVSNGTGWCANQSAGAHLNLTGYWMTGAYFEKEGANPDRKGWRRGGGWHAGFCPLSTVHSGTLSLSLTAHPVFGRLVSLPGVGGDGMAQYHSSSP